MKVIFAAIAALGISTMPLMAGGETASNPDAEVYFINLEDGQTVCPDVTISPTAYASLTPPDAPSPGRAGGLLMFVGSVSRLEWKSQWSPSFLRVVRVGHRRYAQLLQSGRTSQKTCMKRFHSVHETFR